MNDATVFLTKLTNLKKSEVAEIWVPSLGNTINFSPITVKQQKELLKSSIDGNASVVSFAKTLNEIILENCVDKLATLSSIDKHSILVNLRILSMGPSIDIEGRTYDLSKLPLKSIFQTKKMRSVVNYKDIEIATVVPSIKKENEIYEQAIVDIKKLKDANMPDAVPILFGYEIIKFIESITFDGQLMDFQSLSIFDKKQIVENLPVAITQRIVKHITAVRKIEEAVITFPDKTILPINTLFFNAD